jgi:hypothetical protein
MFFLTTVILSAQDAIPAPPACDKIMASTQGDLQKEADANCKTATRCIACTEKKSGAVAYVTLVAQPKCNVRSNNDVAAAAPTDRKTPAGAAATTKTRPAPPTFDILQQRCEDGSGIDLKPLIPGDAAECSKDRYSYLWEIDGSKGGHASDLKCACGKVATLTVTDAKTGLSYSRQVKLSPCRK